MTYPAIAAIIIGILALYSVLSVLAGLFAGFNNLPEPGDDESLFGDYRKTPEDIAREVGP